MIAIAIKIMSTWWYPMNGTNFLHPVANLGAMVLQLGLVVGRRLVTLAVRADGGRY